MTRPPSGDSPRHTRRSTPPRPPRARGTDGADDATRGRRRRHRSLAATACALVALVVLAGCVSVGSPTATPDRAGERDAGTGAAATPSTATPVGTPVPSTRARVTVEVVEVVDGDTVHVRYGNGTRETVRLLGVDTPEVRGETSPDEFEGVPETDDGRQCLRTAGDRASDYARERLAGRTVGLGFDEAEGRRGYYDRLLAYVYVDGRQFNYDLVATGHARVYDSGFLERDRYEAAERAARASGRGVWTCATDRPTGGSAVADGGVAVEVVEIRADAPGNDNGNLAEEYVVVQNVGESTVDLSGWTVADAAGHAYAVPEGTTLEPGATLTIRTGRGTDEPDAGVVYWGRDGAVWNNGGDTVTVRDATGATVTERSY